VDFLDKFLQNTRVIDTQEQMKTHLISRYVDIKLHRPIITNQTATFLLYNYNGQLVGWQRYAPNNKHLSNNSFSGKYYTYRSNSQIAIFGLESVDIKSRIIFITEGIFDAVRLTSYGIPAIALLTNAPNSSMLNFLTCLGRKLVGVCDNDDGGRFLRNRLAKITNAFYTPSTKDLGESSDFEVENLINIFYGRNVHN
jgi:hypothetical protein